MSTNLTTIDVVVETVVDNEFFKAAFSRQSDGKLYGHVTYKVWSPEAKRVSIETLDSFDEPIYAILHDRKMFKFLTALGFTPTGNLATKALPGREDHLFGEVVRVKTDLNTYALSLYDQLGKEIIPLSSIDGFGKVKQLEEMMTKYSVKNWETSHYFSDGVYTRSTFIPSGTLFIGHKHRHSTNCTIATGAMTLLTVDELGYAEDLGVIEGTKTFITRANVQKVGFAHEDTVMLNSFSICELDKQYHNEDSIDMIEDFIFNKEDICQE